MFIQAISPAYLFIFKKHRGDIIAESINKLLKVIKLGDNWKDNACMQEKHADFILPTIEQSIYIPKEGYWVDEESKPHVYLWHLMLQIFQIKEARNEFVQCFNKFRRGPGREWIDLIRRAKPSDGRAKSMKEYYFKMDLVYRKLKDDIPYFSSDEYINRIAKIFTAWIEKWACGNAAMFATAHNICVTTITEGEVFTKKPRTRNRVSMKGIKNMIKEIWAKSINGWEPTSDPSDRLVYIVSHHCGQPLSADWQVILSPKHQRKQRTRRRKARINLRINNQRIESRTVIRAIWCFAKLVILSKENEPSKELNRLILNEYPLPFEELYCADEQDLQRYIKPVIDAMAWQPG
jgi:hypothetical protein